MDWRRRRPLVWWAICLFSAWSVSVPASAQVPERASIVLTTTAPGDKLLLERPDREPVVGSFQGFGESDTAILLRVFDPTASRFSTQSYPVREVMSLSRMETSRSIAYPLLGSLAGGAVGATSAYLLGSDGRGGGDVEHADVGPILAIGLGLTGAFVGFVVGAIVAPGEEKLTVLW